MAGQRDNPRVGEDRPGVSHEEQEDDDVEHDNVKAAPQAPGHGLQHNPSAGIKQSVEETIFIIIIT